MRLLHLLVVFLLIEGCASRKNLELSPAWANQRGRRDTQLELAESLLDIDAVDQALKIISALRHDGYRSGEIDYLQGRALYKMGIFDEAKVLLTRAIKRSSNDDRAYQTLGLLYADNGQVHEAVLTFLDAIRVNNSNAETWNNLGFLYLSERSYLEAEKALGKAVILDSTNRQIRTNLGFAQLALGKESLAQRTFASTGSPVDTQLNLGLGFELQSQFNQAQAHYQQALILVPNHPKALAGLNRLNSEKNP